ncbi:hypothetical protein BLJ79_04185 [Arthrobacter sp. UCD-GKA]|uniref:hypothetical protein n=1 Tax=Arthrobacter sp. UCD-GKA TaxID=1913576 RepID=UPI0008DE1EC2|nr:hypothetical protein [Arthrobacter sp. UCD-GKA]OIH86000.1 hypothetical protein BLJ79_04185 [Arthrobacter sp. UCD-GKA]
MTRIPPALATERLEAAVHAARRTIRRAALAVDTAVFTPGADWQARIEDVVRAGTVLEQAEAELAVAEVAA